MPIFYDYTFLYQLPIPIYTFKAKLLIGIKHANFAAKDVQFYLIKIIL